MTSHRHPAETEDTWYDVLPAPAVAAPGPGERARLDARVRDGVRTQDRQQARVAARRGSCRRLLPPVAVLASVVAVVTLVVVALGSPPPAPRQSTRPVVASAAAVDVLSRAARHVGEGDAVTAPGPDQFVYVRSVTRTNVGRYDGPVTLGERHERELWLSQEPGPAEVPGLIREFGQDWPMGGGVPGPAGVSRPTYAWLASLPTDPEALLDELDAQIPAQDDARTRDQVLFDELTNIMTEMVAPPRTTAAFYAALTRIPGVVVDPGVRDLLGRPGVAIARTEDVFLSRTVLVVDPDSGRTLGSRSLMDTPGGEVVFGSIAVVARGVADEAGAGPLEDEAA